MVRLPALRAAWRWLFLSSGLVAVVVAEGAGSVYFMMGAPGAPRWSIVVLATAAVLVLSGVGLSSRWRWSAAALTLAAAGLMAVAATQLSGVAAAVFWAAVIVNLWLTVFFMLTTGGRRHGDRRPDAQR
jgi:hypothetical protein